jgi:hypothetical protein
MMEAVRTSENVGRQQDKLTSRLTHECYYAVRNKHWIVLAYHYTQVLNAKGCDVTSFPLFSTVAPHCGNTFNYKSDRFIAY